MDISAALDLYFEGISEFSGDRPVTGGMRWRASKLGSCLRAQYAVVMEGAKPSPIDARTQRIFQVGHLTGRLIEDAFRSMGILIETEKPFFDEELNVGANCDLIVGGFIQPVQDDSNILDAALRNRLAATYGPKLPIIGIELKSKSSKSFWWAKKRGEPVAGLNQLIQAATYSLLAKRANYHVDAWQVLSISKDDLVMAQTPVLTGHEEIALARLNLLNAAASKMDVPCECHTMFGGKGWRYCDLYEGKEGECACG